MAKKPAPSKQQPAKGKRRKGGKRKKENIWVKLGRKLFGEKAEEVSHRYAAANPMYEYDEDGIEVKRSLPEGLTKQEEKILQQVRKNAYKLDYTCFGCCCGCSCCGLRFGRASVIGIIPAAGPIIDVTLGVVKVNRKAQKLDLSWGVSTMMYVRHGISEGIGLVPVVGGLWIAWYKVNSRNSNALEDYLKKRAARRGDTLDAD